VKLKKQSNTLYLGPTNVPSKLAKLFKAGSSPTASLEPKLPKRMAPAAAAKRSKPRLLKQRALRVGVWDIDVHAGFLHRVLDRVNKRQSMLSFHPIEVTAPVGITSTGERTRKLVRALGLDGDDRDIASNTLASDIFAVAAPIRAKLTLDLLVALVSPMIMELEPDAAGEVGWNYFSTSRNSVAVVSAFDLRQYAEQSGRPLESCLAMLIAAQVLQEIFSTINSHEEIQGCVFDLCEDRDEIVEGLKSMTVCDASLAEIPKAYRTQVQNIFKAIGGYSR
jgi:hypothetical protein